MLVRPVWAVLDLLSWLLGFEAARPRRLRTLPGRIGGKLRVWGGAGKEEPVDVSGSPANSSVGGMDTEERD